MEEENGTTEQLTPKTTEKPAVRNTWNQDPTIQEPSNQELYKMIQNQQKQIDKLINKTNEIKDNNLQQNTPEHLRFEPGGTNKPTTYAKIVSIIPTDLDGNTNENLSTSEHPENVEFIPVKTSRKKKTPRQKLSDTMNGAINDKLNEHWEQTKDNELKPEKEMSPDTRSSQIKNMLTRSATIVGLAPISKPNLERAHDNMVKRGALSLKEPYHHRMQKVIKSIVMTWTKTHLKMPKEAWTNIDVVEITQPASDEAEIIFIRCKTIEDAARINQYAKNLPQNTSTDTPRLVMHIDPRARPRFNAFNAMAKAIREHSDGNIQTSIRTGRTDYLLRKKTKRRYHPMGKNPSYYHLSRTSTISDRTLQGIISTK